VIEQAALSEDSRLASVGFEEGYIHLTLNTLLSRNAVKVRMVRHSCYASTETFVANKHSIT
jgi:hypothetical protein